MPVQVLDFVARQPVGHMLLKSDPDQLAACSNMRHLKQLMDYGLDRSRRNLEFPGNLFVREAAEDSGKHLLLT